MRNILTILLLMIAANIYADNQNKHREIRAKLSQYVANTLETRDNRRLTAFVKSSSTSALKENNCRILAQWDDLYIASIPMEKIKSLAANASVSRIEASAPMHINNDTSALILGTTKCWNGYKLQQAFTGKDVIVGVQDIGFDFTHPTFGNRIKCFWDMITPDTIGSQMYVGRDYIGNEAIMTLKHSYDGLEQTHGTHTTGSAAGAGYLNQHSGMAYESDIALVCNACSDNANLIDSADYYKYTSATDVLGFKYIFDYADAQKKPCVISYSEGSREDLYEQRLLNEALEKITGPGRIILVAAGNNNKNKHYLHKPAGQDKASAQICADKQVCYFVRSDKHVDNIFTFADKTYTYTTSDITACKDSILRDTISMDEKRIPITICLYPSCWDDSELVYEILCKYPALHFSISGKEAEAEAFTYIGALLGDEAEYGHCVNSPASASAVICVGATGYRDHIINYKGEWKEYQHETEGKKSDFSSVGPTLEGLTKPEIMAPGNNIISAQNSFFMENHPPQAYIDWKVSEFQHNERTYSWEANSGTSMSCPIAAGIVAIWLQANPTLTKDDIIDIFAHTARHYDESLSYPNNEYGYGEIDAYNGLLYILNIQGIVSPKQIDSSVFPLRDGEEMIIYTIDGRRVSNMAKGNVYAIQIKSPDPARCGSMLIRK